jgi:hypothetical protein
MKVLNYETGAQLPLGCIAIIPATYSDGRSIAHTATLELGFTADFSRRGVDGFNMTADTAICSSEVLGVDGKPATLDGLALVDEFVTSDAAAIVQGDLLEINAPSPFVYDCTPHVTKYFLGTRDSKGLPSQHFQTGFDNLTHRVAEYLKKNDPLDLILERPLCLHMLKSGNVLPHEQVRAYAAVIFAEYIHQFASSNADRVNTIALQSAGNYKSAGWRKPFKSLGHGLLWTFDILGKFTEKDLIEDSPDAKWKETVDLGLDRFPVED